MLPDERPKMASLDRRTVLQLAAAGLPIMAWAQFSPAAPMRATDAKTPTRFQIACMTLPYAEFPLQRALKGIQAAGYKYVAWGTTHKQAGEKPVPVISPDAPPQKAKELGEQCR